MIPTHTLLHMLRNPHGHSNDELRAARLQAAEMIEAAEAAKPRPGTFEDDVRRGREIVRDQVWADRQGLVAPPPGISWDAAGHAYLKGDCDRAACEINPCNGSCKTRAPQLDKHTKPITGSLDYEPWASKEAMSAAACKLLHEKGVPMRDPYNHRSGQASGTLTWYFDANNFKASFVWQP